MLTFHVVVVAALLALAQCQRGSFAPKPIGYPELLNKTTTTEDPLGNRFGEGTTERLPLEANGDRDLVDRISQWPIDKQPFWYLNWKALEEKRKNPQTYPQRPSQFAETPNFNAANTGNLGSRFGTPNSVTGTPNSNIGSQNSNSGTQHSNSGTLNSDSGAPNSNIGSQNSNSGTQNSNTGTLNAATNPGTQNSEVSSLGNRHVGTEINSNTGDRRQANTGFHTAGYGHYPYNGYGT